jgi:hypothetical protein
MASTNDVIFVESMADILDNPFDIHFGSMLAKSTTPATRLVIEGNAVTTNQQIRTYLLMGTHPPTPSDLISGIDCVEGMLSDTIKVCERVKCPRRSHLDEPCPIHKNPKHTAHQCSVVKKLHRPLIAAHRRQLNQEPSPDHLVFQITRTTISPIYPGEELETLGREIMVVSTNVPPQDGETDEQR